MLGRAEIGGSGEVKLGIEGKRSAVGCSVAALPYDVVGCTESIGEGERERERGRGALGHRDLRTWLFSLYRHLSRGKRKTGFLFCSCC